MSNIVNDILRAHDANTPKLKETLDRERKEFDDCTPCRVIGASAFIGLGGFTYVSGHNQLKQQRATILKSGSWLGMRARGAGITGMSISLVAIGLYRLVN